MHYIVLDMEWNQPFGLKRLIKEPVVLWGEVIQIGAVKLDEDYRVIDNFKIMVLPKYYKKMHKQVKKITKITTEDLQYGFPFEVAFKHFKKWCGDEFAFLTWGADDIDMLRDNMTVNGIDTDWVPNTYNVQAIFDDQITRERRQVSLTYAMEKIGEEALDAHDALNDARNTARICLRLDMAGGLQEYDESLKRMCSKVEKIVDIDAEEKGYSTRSEAFEDPDVVHFHCSFNNMKVKCIDIIRQNGSKYIGIGKCENGDELFVRFKFWKRIDGKFSVNRMIYEMNEFNKNYYLNKKKQLQEKREQSMDMLDRMEKIEGF